MQLGRRSHLKVAYIFPPKTASTFQLAAMILPQLECGVHGAEADGMFFSYDNTICLRWRNSIEKCMAKAAPELRTLLITRDRCAVRRNLAGGTLEQCGKGGVTAKGTVEGATAGCVPQLFDALSNPSDQIITDSGCHRHMHGDDCHCDQGCRLEPEDPTQCIPR